MDKTVIFLIAAGVCCVVIGIALFAKLLTTKPDDEAGDKGKLLDNEYMENFKECFENTGSIEETLEQLADIYTGNEYMYNLIISALDFINDEQGDYETALENINVDGDVAVMKMHNTAIKKALNLEVKHKKQVPEEKHEDKMIPEKQDEEEFEEDEVESKQEETHEEESESEVEEEFEEDEEDEEYEKDEKDEKDEKEPEANIQEEENPEPEEDDDDDLDGFKIG